MANWGEMNVQRLRAKLEALKSAEEATSRRSGQMVSGIRGIGESFSGLSDMFQKLGTEKRGYAHEKEMATDLFDRQFQLRRFDVLQARDVAKKEAETAADVAILDRASAETIAAIRGGSVDPGDIATIWDSTFNTITKMHPEMWDEFGNFQWVVEDVDELRRQFKSSFLTYEGLSVGQVDALMAQLETHLGTFEEVEVVKTDIDLDIDEEEIITDHELITDANTAIRAVQDMITQLSMPEQTDWHEAIITFRKKGVDRRSFIDAIDTIMELADKLKEPLEEPGLMRVKPSARGRIKGIVYPND